MRHPRPQTTIAVQCYAHDDLWRIASVDCVNGATNRWNQRFTSSGASYDAFGNVMKAVPPGGTGISFLPTYSSTTNRFATLPGCTPTYDADGNLTNDCTHTYTWDAEGKMLTLDGNSVVLTYDALDV